MSAAPLAFDDFWAGTSRHLLDEPTRRTLRDLAGTGEAPTWEELATSAGVHGAALGPVAAYHGYLPRAREPGYARVSEENRGHVVLDTRDPAVLACFAAWRHRRLPMRTEIIATPAWGPGGKPEPGAPPTPEPRPHPYTDDND